MPRLLLATRNQHKIRELARLLPEGVELAGLDAFPEILETVEDQPTLEGNAAKKAREAASGSGLWALADDTGLEVEALGGSPGVLSARYAGPGCTYAENNRKLLAAMAGVPEGRRRAVFRTVMALSSPQGRTLLEEGRLEGEIARAPAGENGFGYDPVFRVPGLGRTLAELSLEEKNALSHRFRALSVMLPRVKKALASAACALLALALCLPARAARTEPGQETIWDEIMASQARRDLARGSQLLDDKDYELAVEEFSRAVAANPDDPMAHMMLGVAHYWTGQVDQSLDDYRKSLSLDPNNAQTHMLIGISLAWKGMVPQAYEEFKKAAEIDPSRPDIQMNLGSIEDNLGLTLRSLDHFRKAVELAPKEPLYHYQLALLYRKLGRDSDAVTELREALKYYPDYEDALLELGAADERRGDLRAAIRDFKRAVDLKARDAVARFRLGRLYLQEGDDKDARATFLDAFHLTPEEGGPGLQLAVSYAGGKTRGPAPDGGQPKPSQPKKPAAPKPPSNDPLDVFKHNLERVPLNQGAILQVDVIFAPRPKLVKASAESRSSLKNALERTLEPEREAPKALRREYEIPSGSARERAAQISKIIDDLRKTMQQAPPNTDVHLGMNLAFKRLQDVTTGGGGSGGEAGSGRGDASSQPKVSYEPRQVGNDLGLWIIGTGWMSLVEEVLPDPGEPPPNPQQSDSWVATGLGYATVGDGERALDAFERALQIEPRNEAALLGRGVAHVMLGQDQAAIASFREVLKLNPKDRSAGEGLKWMLRPAATKGS